MKTKSTQLAILLAITLGASACSKIPSGYRGRYEDRSQGATLILKASKAQLTFSDGRKLQAKAEDLNFAAVAEGKAGIFVRENPASNILLEVFWVNPNVATQQAVEGFHWFEAELLYTLLDTRREEAAQSLKLLHCTHGTVMLDTTTQEFEMGCPAGSPDLKMVRVEN